MRRGENLTRNFTAYDRNKCWYQRWKSYIIAKFVFKSWRATSERNFDVPLRGLHVKHAAQRGENHGKSLSSWLVAGPAGY
jgi:hypothetical protein